MSEVGAFERNEMTQAADWELQDCCNEDNGGDVWLHSSTAERVLAGGLRALAARLTGPITPGELETLAADLSPCRVLATYAMVVPTRHATLTMPRPVLTVIPGGDRL